MNPTKVGSRCRPTNKDIDPVDVQGSEFQTGGKCCANKNKNLYLLNTSIYGDTRDPIIEDGPNNKGGWRREIPSEVAFYSLEFPS